VESQVGEEGRPAAPGTFGFLVGFFAARVQDAAMIRSPAQAKDSMSGGSGDI